MKETLRAWFLGLLLILIGLFSGLTIESTWHPFASAVNVIAPGVAPTPTPYCFKTSNYQNGQLVSIGYRCVPVTPEP